MSNKNEDIFMPGGKIEKINGYTIWTSDDYEEGSGEEKHAIASKKGVKGIYPATYMRGSKNELAATNFHPVKKGLKGLSATGIAEVMDSFGEGKYLSNMNKIYNSYNKGNSVDLSSGFADNAKNILKQYSAEPVVVQAETEDPTIPKPVTTTPSNGVYIDTIHSGKTPENIDSNTFADIKKIYDYKKDWVAYDKAYKDALEAGDEKLAQEYLEKRDNAHINASQHYISLDEKLTGVSDDLHLSTVDNAYKILKMYAKNGKSSFRPYVSNVLKNTYGMSQEDIDKAITYDEDTEEVSLGGINLGKPFSEVDGVSYWDTDVMDNAIMQFTEKNGITIPDDKRNDIQSQNVIKKYNELLEQYANENAFETEEGKSILDRYDTKSWDAGYNTAAKGAASNGGNLDSFAAANAMRQQAALRQEGEALALAAHNQKIQNIAGILANLGVEVQNDFDRSQTAKINDSNIRYQDAETGYKNAETGYKNAETAKLKSDVTGLVPDEWLPDYTNPKNNKFLTADGGVVKLSNEGGYATLMQNALVTIASNTASAEEKNAARETYNQANTARNILLQSDPELMEQYGHTIKANLPAQTFDNQQFWAGIGLEKYAIDNDVYLGKYGIDAEERMNLDNNATAKYGFDIDYKKTDRESAAAENISKDTLEGTKHTSDNEYKAVVDAATITTNAEKDIQQMKSDTDTYGFDTSLKIAQMESTPSVDQKEYIYDQLVDYLNKINKEFHENTEAQAIKKNDDGSYSIVARNDEKKTGSGPKGIVSNIWQLVGNNQITSEFAKQFLKDMGILESEINRILKELEAEQAKK